MVVGPLTPLRLVYVGIPVLTSLVGLGLSAWIYTYHWDERGSKWVVAFLSLQHGWMLSLTLFLLPLDPAVRKAAGVTGSVFTLATLGVWVVAISRYTRLDFHRNRLVGAGLGYVAVGFPLLLLTSGSHSLLFAPWVRFSEPFPYYFAAPGPGFVSIIVVVVILAGYSILMLAKYLLSAPRESGPQLVALILGGLALPVMELLGSMGAFPVEHLSYAAYGLLPFNVLIFVALFRFRLLSVQPVARNAVVEALEDPVVVLDGDGRLVDYNEQATRLWPALPDRVGERFSAACPELADSLDALDSSPEETTRVTLERDGGRQHYSVTRSEVTSDGSGRVAWYPIVLRNVTELERSRWQLAKQNDRLDQVASTISHDLRNPIGVADGYAELIEDALDGDGIDGEDADRIRDALGKNRTALERMEEIIDDVLALAREGQTVTDTETVTLSTVAREAWETVETGTATLEIDADRSLEADRGKLRTIFENLYRNAVEHGGPAVTVRVGATDDGFYVQDDGRGIPADETAVVFEYGYTTDDDGTGLGLSIVRTMAESHGWTAELDADCDDGARFVFAGVGSDPVPGRELASERER